MPEALMPYPHPWVMEWGDGDLAVIRSVTANRVVAVCAGEHAEANALLICAAPEMMLAVRARNLAAAEAALVARGL